MKKSILVAAILVAAFSAAAVQTYALPALYPNQSRTNNTMSSTHINGCCSMNGNGMMNGSMMGGSKMTEGQSMNYEQCQQNMGQSHYVSQDQCQGMM